MATSILRALSILLVATWAHTLAVTPVCFYSTNMYPPDTWSSRTSARTSSCCAAWNCVNWVSSRRLPVLRKSFQRRAYRRTSTLYAQRMVDASLHQAFVEDLLAMTGDPLETNGGRMVVFRGNPQARLMMVGEAPGAEEDMLGVPFVGRSGQLLDDVLRAVGFDPEEDIYVTNIVRRRPPNNRPPTPEELDFYLPAVLEEIRLVNPDIIVTLGASATKALLPNEARGITKTRGQWVPNEELEKIHEGALAGKLLMPWFHPSYLLRNASERSKQKGGVRWLTREDLREVKRVFDSKSY